MAALEVGRGADLSALGQLLGPVTSLPRRRKGAEIVALPGGKLRVRGPATDGRSGASGSDF
jgi:hypothetical protein